MQTALFGPGGNSESFKETFSSSLDAPAWIASKGLDLYEYECVRGVNISEEAARTLGENARRNGIEVTLHAPYYISLSSDDPERREKNSRYVIDSCRAVGFMGGEKVVVHCGGLNKRTRAEALKNTIDGLGLILRAMDEERVGGILCIETMGKINVIGDLEEVMQICESDERLFPCIDFGHLNARTMGGLRSYREYAAVLDEMKNRLGAFRASNFHAHFSRIEYSEGGEVRHLNFNDEGYGPEPEPLMKLLAERRLTPTVVCESAGMQAEDALKMKCLYQKYMEGCG